MIVSCHLISQKILTTLRSKTLFSWKIVSCLQNKSDQIALQQNKSQWNNMPNYANFQNHYHNLNVKRLTPLNLMLWRSVCLQALYSSTKVVSSSPVDLRGELVSIASSSHKLKDISTQFWWWFHNCLAEYYQLKEDSLKGLFFSCEYTKKTAILKRSPLVLVSFSLYTSLFFKFLQFHDKSLRAIILVVLFAVADSLFTTSLLHGKKTMKTPFGANDVTFWSKGNLRQSLYKNLTRGLNLMLISS